MKTISDAQGIFIKNAMNAPYLERDDEHQLALDWKNQQDQQAYNKLITAHMRLVISIAAKFKNYGLSSSDLIQEGHIGLLEAAARFDPDREVRFSTYATWWIRASIQDYILRNWSIVRGGTSSAQKSLFFNLRRLRAKLYQQDDILSEPQIYQQISDTLGISKKDVEMMDSRLSGGDVSMNAPVSEGDGQSITQKQDFFVSDDPLPEDIVSDDIDGAHIRDHIKTAFKCLNDRELHIIKARKFCDQSQTLESLGKGLCISKERVRQIENRSLEKVKSELMKQDQSLKYFFS